MGRVRLGWLAVVGVAWACGSNVAEVRAVNPLRLVLSDPPRSSGAVEPTTAPASEAVVRQWLEGLDDTSPVEREKAYFQLLGLEPRPLDVLKKVVAGVEELQPSQRAVLRDIVTHVYLRGQPSQKGGGGFLGVMLGPDESLIEPGSEQDVLVQERLPGLSDAADWRHHQSPERAQAGQQAGADPGNQQPVAGR